MSSSKNTKRVSFRRNVPRLYVQAIFALAAALALTTSACGKSDGGGGAVPAQKLTAPAGTKDTATIGKVSGTGTASTTSTTAKTGKSELDKTSSTSSSTAVKRGEGADSGGASATDTTAKTGLVEYTGEGEPDPYAPKPVEEVKPVVVAPKQQVVSLQEESVVYYNKNGMTADQIFAHKNEVNMNGAVLGEIVRSDIVNANGEPLYYTGGGQDTLREHLYTLVNESNLEQDSATRAGNKELAQSIQLSNFRVNWVSRRADVNFQFIRVGSDGKLNLTRVLMQGPLDALGRFQVKDLKRAPHLAAEVACMDISGGCQTVHIKVTDSSSGCLKVAHLIARHTSATMYIEGNPQGVAKNSEYDRLMTVLLNTVYQPKAENVVEQLTMTTSETMGGASNFAVTMKMRLANQAGYGGDTIEISGPLAKPRGGDTLDVAALVSPALTIVNGEIVPTDAIGTEGRFVDTIREARLVRNDGRGNLQLDMTVRAATVDAREDKIRLTIARIHTPTSGVRLSMQ